MGDFTFGQQGAQYTVVVSNATNVSATTGSVNVSDAIPEGLNFVSMSGMGWSCEGTACSRSDVLAAGASYPAITVTVNVPMSSSSSEMVVNMASVSGGGSATASASDPTNLVAVPFVLTVVPPAGGSPNTPFPVTPGGQVAVPLLLTPIPGLPSTTVTFSCTSSAPQFLTCAPAPSKVTLSPGGTQVAVVANTYCKGDVPANSPINNPMNGPGSLLGALELLLAALTLASTMWAYRHRSRWALSFAVLMLVALGSAACNSLPKGPNGATPPGNYTLFITATANGQSAQVQVPILVVQ